jgi:RNA polymerase primary sigma factor
MRAFTISQSITNRDSLSLEKYLQDISREKLITVEEEEELMLRISNGDSTARQRLVRGNLRFVVSVAKKYQGHGLPLSDLVNEGNLGLMRAAERFDHTRGFKFISFAVWWIRQSILHAIVTHADTIRLPINRVLLRNRLHQAQVMLEQQLERTPTPEEVAESLELDPDEVMRSMCRNTKAQSLDMPLSDDDEGSMLDLIENPNAEYADRSVNHTESLQRELRRSLKMLDDRQEKLLCYYFGIGMERPLSTEDIAAKFDLSQERVRQIRDKAIEKLRRTRNTLLLRAYLG